MSVCPPNISLFAAGSLRSVLTEIAAGFSAQTGGTVTGTFGASGLLRERIEQGEAADLFASADAGHPAQLARRGGWSRPTTFTRNALCALVRADLDISTRHLLEALLNPEVRVATSTPRCDPSGDYAWEVFRRAEALVSGAHASLVGKALQLTGGRSSPPPPADGNVYAAIIAGGQADLFLTYRTNALAAVRENPALKIVALPPELEIDAECSFTLHQRALPPAREFADYLLSDTAQDLFARHGFRPL